MPTADDRRDADTNAIKSIPEIDEDDDNPSGSLEVEYHCPVCSRVFDKVYIEIIKKIGRKYNIIYIRRDKMF